MDTYGNIRKLFPGSLERDQLHEIALKYEVSLELVERTPKHYTAKKYKLCDEFSKAIAGLETF